MVQKVNNHIINVIQSNAINQLNKLCNEFEKDDYCQIPILGNKTCTLGVFFNGSDESYEIARNTIVFEK